MLGICQAISVPNTNEMSIKLVRAARITDTTGALLGESRGRRRPQSTVKINVFEHPAQDTYKSVDRIRAGVGREYSGGPTKGSAAVSSPEAFGGNRRL